MEMKKKILEYDMLKFLAIILVVLSHSTYYKITSNFGEFDFGGIDYQYLIRDDKVRIIYKVLDKLKQILYYFHMPMFMALSGALFSLQAKKDRWVSFQQLFKNKFRRLILPFLIFTVFYTVPVKYISNYFQNIGIIKAIVGQVFLLGNSHLWYLYALFVIFIISYFLLRKENGIIIFIVLYIIHIISFFIEITIINKPTQFAFWFALGFLFNLKREQWNKLIVRNRYLTVLIGLNFILFTILYNYIKSSFIFFNIAMLDILAILGSVFFYNISYFLSRNKYLINSNVYKMILINGLGIYIFSDTLNYLILYIAYTSDKNFMVSSIGMISLVLVRFIITLIGGLLLTVVFKNIFKKYTWLVN